MQIISVYSFVALGKDGLFYGNFFFVLSHFCLPTSSIYLRKGKLQCAIDRMSEYLYNTFWLLLIVSFEYLLHAIALNKGDNLCLFFHG